MNDSVARARADSLDLGSRLPRSNALQRGVPQARIVLSRKRIIRGIAATAIFVGFLRLYRHDLLGGRG